MDRSGERFIPQQADPFDEIAVEHLQRYQSVKSLVRGKAVLDAGSGEGYGTHLLAQTAAKVVGLDISSEAVENARAVYRRQNLEYRVGSIHELPFPSGSFNVVVSFEVIEHVAEEVQEGFLREARRVLRSDGILVVSTPNKAVYSDRESHHNEFHVKEFYVDEFESFLRRTFPAVRLFGQSWSIASVLQQSSSRRLDRLIPEGGISASPKYVIAVCGSVEPVAGIDISSVVVDPRGQLEKIESRILELQREVDARNVWAASLEGKIRHLDQRILDLQAEVESKNDWAASLTQDIEVLGQSVDHYKKESAAFEARVVKAHDHIALLDTQIETQGRRIVHLQNKEAELESIKISDFWKAAVLYWKLRDEYLPMGSRRRRLLKAVFRTSKAVVKGLKRSGRQESHSQAEGAPGVREGVAPPDPEWIPEPIHFPKADRPKVSIIIPAFNQWAHTYRCLQSIRRTMAELPCEVILADDGSTDETARAGDLLAHVRILRDGNNRGFLRNCNWAAGFAGAPYLFFLNNDTELQPGAIQALVALLDRDPGVGMAGSKLTYPDGRLQEAGGIIWNDGSGWNFGRGQDPSLPAFNYAKEVDYVSGASFMIRNDLWKEIGGFDDRYAPAYAEDSDLAFEVRKRGFKVVYQPQSVVIHFEGVSHGTDVAADTKAYQVRNTELLRIKWADELSRQFASGAEVFYARDRSRGRKTVLMIDHYIPQFDKDAGSRTMWSFIQAFLKMGTNVKFMGDNFFPHQPYTDMLQQAGVEVLTGGWFADNWPEWIEENAGRLDFVFLSRPHIAPKYLRPVRSLTKARVLYYVHDLHYLREEKLAELGGGAPQAKKAEKTRAEEQRLMNRMDVILSCSSLEAEIIHGLCPEVDVRYVPPYAVDVDLADEFDSERRAGLLFVGGFVHPPNADGVLWFIKDIWPGVREKLPGVVFQIAGSDPPPEIRSLACDDVMVLGYVSEDRLEELYRTTRLAVIPLRYGAGVKGKTVEAMARGVPVACTPWGVEGMPGVEEILDPAQSSGDLAAGIVSLYQDPARLSLISRNQRAYVAGHYTLERIQEVFAQVIESRG